MSEMTIEEMQFEINACQILLKDTDYKATKFAEGWMTAEEYEPMRLKRQGWRDRINELEALIEEAQLASE